MITIKDLMEVKMKQVHIALLSEKPTTTAVANLHHVLSQDGKKIVYHTSNITDEIKKHYQNSGINHKHFFNADGAISTVFDAIDKTKEKTNAPITLHVHPNQIDSVTKSVKSTHPNTVISVKSLPHNKNESKTFHPSIKKEDLKSLKENFEVGDFVKIGDIEGEIINLHPKYATVISEGKEHRVWVDGLELSENQPKRNQLYKESYIYKGYKTKNFNRMLSETFKDISVEEKDEYALLECIKVLDFILEVTDKTIEENFKGVRIQTERLKRYSKRVGASYLTDAIISAVEEELLKYSIIEGINFTTTDRNMVAKVVSMVAGISINNTDPTNSVNQAAIQLRKSQLTSQGWQMVGRLMNVATKAGIRWNKDTFSDSIKKEMKLI
jgi:hypothetical protein